MSCGGLLPSRRSCLQGGCVPVWRYFCRTMYVLCLSVVPQIDSTLPPGINPADPADAKFLLKHAKDT